MDLMRMMIYCKDRHRNYWIDSVEKTLRDLELPPLKYLVCQRAPKKSQWKELIKEKAAELSRRNFLKCLTKHQIYIGCDDINNEDLWMGAEGASLIRGTKLHLQAILNEMMTDKKLFTIKQSSNDDCCFCEDDIGSLQHYLLSCPNLRGNTRFSKQYRQIAETWNVHFNTDFEEQCDAVKMNYILNPLKSYFYDHSIPVSDKSKLFLQRRKLFFHLDGIIKDARERKEDAQSERPLSDSRRRRRWRVTGARKVILHSRHSNRVKSIHSRLAGGRGLEEIPEKNSCKSDKRILIHNHMVKLSLTKLFVNCNDLYETQVLKQLQILFITQATADEIPPLENDYGIIKFWRDERKSLKNYVSSSKKDPDMTQSILCMVRTAAIGVMVCEVDQAGFVTPYSIFVSRSAEEDKIIRGWVFLYSKNGAICDSIFGLKTGDVDHTSVDLLCQQFATALFPEFDPLAPRDPAIPSRTSITMIFGNYHKKVHVDFLGRDGDKARYFLSDISQKNIQTKRKEVEERFQSKYCQNPTSWIDKGGEDNLVDWCWLYPTRVTTASGQGASRVIQSCSLISSLLPELDMGNPGCTLRCEPFMGSM